MHSSYNPPSENWISYLHEDMKTDKKEKSGPQNRKARRAEAAKARDRRVPKRKKRR